MKSKMLISLLTIPLLVNSPTNPQNAVLVGKIKNEKIDIKIESKNEIFEKMVKEAKDKLEREEQEKRRQLEIQKKLERQKIERQKIEEQKKKYGNNFKQVQEVLVDITYYFAEDSALQGGHNDRKGRPLAGHGTAVCALPSDVPYGSLLVLDEPVVVDTNFSKSNKLKNVDTGGAITWLNSNKTHMKVDVFVKGCYSLDWIINNLKNKKSIKAKLYYSK